MSSATATRRPENLPLFLEFFAGSGLVGLAFAPYFAPAWANDVCPKKAAVFTANHPASPFVLGSITGVQGKDIPPAALSWASFPCQDLSLAGAGKGIQGKRSGLVWEWLRVMDAMAERPRVLAAENVSGLVSSQEGAHYKELHKALASRGYKAGALLLDAARWLPQSRPRIFVVAVAKACAVPPELIADGPTWAHPPAVQKAASGLKDWVWWNIPAPTERPCALSEIIDLALPCQDAATSRKNIAMIPPAHMRRLEESGLHAAPGYKRTRQGEQVLELRFDDVAGCLRTPSGGNSRQYLVVRTADGWRTRFFAPRETARLMGAPESFRLPGSPNDGYRAMGDAVAKPVAAHLAKHLLSPLAAGGENIGLSAV